MGWETLEKRREYHLNLSVFKCLSGLVPNALCNVFTLVGDSHSLFTRSSAHGKIRPIRPSLEYGKRSFQYRGALSWNQLRDSVTSPLPTSTGVFKCKYYSKAESDSKQ